MQYGIANLLIKTNLTKCLTLRECARRDYEDFLQ